MNLLQDILTYVRRIIKSPSNAQITDALLVDYVNRFWLSDVDARIQLFDLKTTYQFQTTPGFDKYNMPLYNPQVELGSQTISSFPMYQGFLSPARVQGINVPLYTQRGTFFDLWPNYIQTQVNAGTGDGTAGPYTLNLPFFPALPGNIDISGIIASGANSDPIYGSNLITSLPPPSIHPGVYITSTDDLGRNIVVSDSGQFFDGVSTSGNIVGLLMDATNMPKSYDALSSNTYSLTQNVVNYSTGVISNLTFPTAIPAGNPINVQSYFFQLGLPRAVLFFNNTLYLRNPPDKAYLIELDAYLTPSAFLTTSQALVYGYMCEYIARGAARKILADTGDIEQFQFYEPLFKEQETLVWKRSQRQNTSTRTDTIYSYVGFQTNYNQSSLGT